MSRIIMLLFNNYSPDPRVKQEADTLASAGHEVMIFSWKRNAGSTAFKEKKFRVINTGPHLPDDFSTKDALSQAIIKLYSVCRFSSKTFFSTIKNKMDIVHAHDLDMLPLGVLISKIKGIPVVYDSHEIYPQMVARDMKCAVKPLKFVEKFLIKYVTRIITVTKYHKEYFENMGASNIIVVTNCKTIKSTKYDPPHNEKFTLIYIGGFNRTRFLHEAIEVCGNIDGIEFKIAGYGQNAKELEKEASEAPMRNVIYLGRIPGEEVIAMTGEADAVMCMLDPKNYNNRVGPPNKIFEAMVSGRPIIATKGTFSGEVVEKERIGLAVNFTKDDFRNAVIQLRDDRDLRRDLGMRSLETALTKYNWNQEGEKLLATYNKL